MNDYIEKIITDVSKKLNIKLSNKNIHFYTDGASNSIVFSILNKYLIKTLDTTTFNAQTEFLEYYKNIPNFQKILFKNKKLNYICFEFIEGALFKNCTNLDINDIINQIYNIVNQYKAYDYDKFGYLFEDNKSWYDFLKDEILNSNNYILNLNIDTKKVFKALEKLKKFNVNKNLIHGDFGAHNFLIDSSKKLKIIDPMPVVGDYLYDFYFAIFSNVNLFKDEKINYILNFFENEIIEKKKALMLIVVFIRMGRCYKYDIEYFNTYLNLYNSYNI